MKLLMFTKHLQELPVVEMARAVKDLGFDGVDLTTRSGGSVLPERVAVDLPKVVEIMAGHDLEVGMLTTGITAADEPHTEAVFRAAAGLGIRFLKLGYFRYERFGTLAEQIEAVRARLRGLAPLARRHKVTACIHTHSGDFIPPDGEILHLLLDGFDPAEIAAYPDPGHMTVEGGLSAWKMGLDLLAGRIRLVAIKDFGWFQEDNAKLGKPSWVAKLVPLAEGIVRWPDVFECLRLAGFDGYFSVHSEYQGSHSFRDLSTREVIEQTRQDLAYLRGVLAAAAPA